MNIHFNYDIPQIEISLLNFPKKDISKYQKLLKLIDQYHIEVKEENDNDLTLLVKLSYYQLFIENLRSI